MADLFLWLKALHIIAVIAWMAGLFYLPRLFVYHTQAMPGTAQSETFKVMERKLLRIIMNPAMIASWIFGLWAAYEAAYFTDIWFIVKLGLVVIMTLYHGILTRCTRMFAVDRNQRSEKFFRIINEIPTLLMIAVVILVVLRPF